MVRLIKALITFQKIIICRKRAATSDRYRFIGPNGVIFHKLPTENDMCHIFWKTIEDNNPYGIYIFHIKTIGEDKCSYTHKHGNTTCTEMLPIDLDYSSINNYNENVMEMLNDPHYAVGLFDFVNQGNFFMFDEKFPNAELDMGMQKDFRWSLSREEDRFVYDKDGEYVRDRLVFNDSKYNVRIVSSLLVFSIFFSIFMGVL